MLKKYLNLVGGALLASSLVLVVLPTPASGATATGLSPAPADLTVLPLTVGANSDVRSVQIDFDPVDGTSTYQCALASGALPTGMSLNAGTCTISGGTTQLETVTFTLDVQDTANSNAVDASVTYTIEVQAYSLQNDGLRFGSGANHSISPSGVLQQPWYKSPVDNNWYPLIYDNPQGYSVDVAFGVGSGGVAWHDNTAIYDLTDDLEENLGSNPLTITGWKVDTSGFTTTGTSLGVVIGYGTLETETKFKDSTGAEFVLHNVFELGETDNFMKATSSIENLTGSAWDNFNMWVGTRDDYVGTDDDPTNTKGNFVNGAFEAITNQADQAKVIMTTSADEGTFFYSTEANANTIIYDCCDFKELFPIDPELSDIADSADDSSYGFVLNLGTVANGATSTNTVWYFGGGATSALGSVASALAQSSGLSDAPVAARPYVGPVAQSAAVSGSQARVTGSVLSGVTKVEINGMSVPFVIESDQVIVITLPEGLQPGTYDVVFTSSYGRLTVQDLLRIQSSIPSAASQEDFKPWTVRQGDTGLAKFYSKNVIGAGKVQFFLNGEEIAWVRAANTSDSKLREANGSYYLVRTVDLVEGQKNALEIYVDGQRVWRAAYTY